MINIHELKDVYVTGDNGIILSSELEYLPYPKSIYKLWSYNEYYENIKNKSIERATQCIRSGDYEHVDETCCYVRTNYNIYPFGHLYDSLQFVHDYEKQGLSCQPWLVGRLTSHVTRLKEHFKVFGCKQHISTHPGKVYKVKKLYVSKHSVYPSQFDADKVPWIREKYYSYYKSEINNSSLQYMIENTTRLSPYNKMVLYLHRPNKRRVLNYDEIHRYIKQTGIVVMDGMESISMKIKLFDSADIIIGPHGSMFRNAMYASNPEDLICHEWCPDNREDVSIMNAMKSCGVDKYTQTSVPGDDKFNITIPIHQIEGVLKDL